MVKNLQGKQVGVYTLVVNSEVAIKWAHEMLDELNEYVARVEKKTPLDVECRENARRLLVDLHKILEQRDVEPV